MHASTPTRPSGTPRSTGSATPDVKPDIKPLMTMLMSRPAGGIGMKKEGGQKMSQGGYQIKLKRIKKAIKDTIFVNGAVCDEVLRTEEKLAKAKEERRFLLRKLLQHQSSSETSALLKAEPAATVAKQVKTQASGPGIGDMLPGNPPTKPTKGVKRKNLAPSPQPPMTQMPGMTQEGGKKTKAGKDIKNSGAPRAKKGAKNQKKTIPPLMLDSLGRPVFPMPLGDVTLHSIGEIVPELPSFHCTESIYPLGYCSTRLYASVNSPGSPCLYTCKISDDTDMPMFEIAAEDSSDLVFRGESPSECHTQLLEAINKARGDIVPTDGRGLDFFGLSNPVIQNLIQSCPGARKCSGYKWVKFEINKAETNDNMEVGAADPRVTWGAFNIHTNALGQSRSSGALITLSEPPNPSNNLRSLLTKAHSQIL